MMGILSKKFNNIHDLLLAFPSIVYSFYLHNRVNASKLIVKIGKPYSHL